MEIEVSVVVNLEFMSGKDVSCDGWMGMDSFVHDAVQDVCL